MEENKQSKKGVIIAIMLAIIAILIASGVGVAVTQTKYLKGEKGNDGYTPIKGVDYFDGEDGKNGISIKGDKGDKGDRGATGTGGSDGADGRDGKDGVDCPPNQNPDVTAILNGTYERHECYWRHWYIFNITATIDDPENDNMHITIYNREDINDSWVEEVEYIGSDGNYSAERTLKYHCFPGNITLYWLVETWDGADIGLNYYEYTIIPEIE